MSLINLPTEKNIVIPGAGQRIAHMNLSATKLVELAVRRGEGELTETGALSVSTGPYTGRSPEDRSRSLMANILCPHRKLDVIIRCL